MKVSKELRGYEETQTPKGMFQEASRDSEGSRWVLRGFKEFQGDAGLNHVPEEVSRAFQVV